MRRSQEVTDGIRNRWTIHGSPPFPEELCPQENTNISVSNSADADLYEDQLMEPLWHNYLQYT